MIEADQGLPDAKMGPSDAVTDLERRGPEEHRKKGRELSLAALFVFSFVFFVPSSCPS